MPENGHVTRPGCDGLRPGGGCGTGIMDREQNVTFPSAMVDRLSLRSPETLDKGKDSDRRAIRRASCEPRFRRWVMKIRLWRGVRSGKTRTRRWSFRRGSV